jgi:hypothetical protein
MGRIIATVRERQNLKANKPPANISASNIKRRLSSQYRRRINPQQDIGSYQKLNA